MKRLSQEEQEQQRNVADRHKKLQAAVPTKTQPPLPEDFLEALKQAEVTEEHVQAAKAHLTKPLPAGTPNPFQFGPRPGTAKDNPEGAGAKRWTRQGIGKETFTTEGDAERVGTRPGTVAASTLLGECRGQL